jgi:DNA-binding XRE family transcriptional regulator
MDKKEFSLFRKKLSRTQKEMAQLLGTSLKAVHSYEQGWRKIPPHIERQIFYLVAKQRGTKHEKKSCWVINKCLPSKRKKCPAWEFQSGDMCWFVCGTRCSDEIYEKWSDKMVVCRTCKILEPLLEDVHNQ